MPSCILFQNDSATLILADIPRSIEQAQAFSSASNQPRLLSSEPLNHPYPSLDPKSTKAKRNIGQSSIQELLLQRHLQLALNGIKAEYDGPWCLPRVTSVDIEPEECQHDPKRFKKEVHLNRNDGLPSNYSKHDMSIPDQNAQLYYHNSSKSSIKFMVSSDTAYGTIPPKATILQGDISQTLSLINNIPKINLAVLDPPWPNRSARRKQSYDISYGTPEIRQLLFSLPIYDILADEGLVAVWVTNKPAFRDLLLDEGGLFEAWGIHLVEEWIWLKVTSEGDPICDLDSLWRKPYEVLLLGRKSVKGDSNTVERRVIVAVPDLHSRKPSLEELFETIFWKRQQEYQALEIFARNLTTGWWSWGNEVLKFQMDYCWMNN
jgi:N6-adenosine-specific RNA methylase IME4